MALAHSPKIVKDGLVLCLDAANSKSYPGTGTTWTDLAGNGYNGTLVNGPTYSSNNLGSISFDGVNDYASSISIENPNGQLTCEVAMNYNSKGEYHNIFDTDSSPMLWIDSNNKLEVSTGTGFRSSLSYNNQNIIVTATYNSISSPGIELYVNGVSVGTRTLVHSSWSNPTIFRLFNRNGFQTYSGKIYFLKFYNRVLSADEIAQNFNALRGRYEI